MDVLLSLNRLVLQGVEPVPEWDGNKMREMFLRKRCYYESAIRDAIAQGSLEPGDPAEKAVALNGLIEGTLTQARILNDPAVLKTLPDLALRILGAKQIATAKS